jgi:hypothetical protein
MPQTRHPLNPVVISALILSVALLSAGLLDRPAASYDEARPAATQWEFHTTTVNQHEYPDTLNKLGSDGWEVFSINRYESQVFSESGDTYLRATQLMLTA